MSINKNMRGVLLFDTSIISQNTSPSQKKINILGLLSQRSEDVILNSKADDILEFRGQYVNRRAVCQKTGRDVFAYAAVMLMGDDRVFYLAKDARALGELLSRDVCAIPDFALGRERIDDGGCVLVPIPLWLCVRYGLYIPTQDEISQADVVNTAGESKDDKVNVSESPVVKKLRDYIKKRGVKDGV